jgi:hypothetical protein
MRPEDQSLHDSLRARYRELLGSLEDWCPSEHRPVIAMALYDALALHERFARARSRPHPPPGRRRDWSDV